MTTSFFRKNGSEVGKIDPNNQPFDEKDTEFYAVLIDPILPDGPFVRNPNPPGSAEEGPDRELGWSKIALPETNTIRNATQEEIDAFVDFAEEDADELDAIRAKQLQKDDKVHRKVFTARTDEYLVEFNELRQAVEEQALQWEKFKVDLQASIDLTALKTATDGQDPVKDNFPEIPLAAMQARQNNRIKSKD